MRPVSRRFVGLVAAMLIAGACSGNPAPDQLPTGTASVASAPAASGSGETITPTITDAALNEQLFRNWIRDAAGLKELLGPDAQAILEASDAAEARFGEGLLADIIDTYALDLTARGGRRLGAVASLDRLPPADPVRNAEWNGSLVGNTSFMVSMWMGMAPQFFGQASATEFRSDTLSKTETRDSTKNGITEHLVLKEQAKIGFGAGKISVDLVLTSDSTLTDSNGTVVATRTSKSTGKFEIDGCPDAGGVAKGKYSVSNEETVTSGGESRRGASVVDGSFDAHNDDSAHLIGTNFAGFIAAGAQSGGTDAWGYSGNYTISVSAGGDFKFGSTGASGNATQAQLSSSAWLLAMTAHYLATAAKEAETFWRSGKCIELKPSRESGKVKPKEEIDLKVEAVAKFGDKGPINAPIQATFSGKESLDPSGRPVEAPASFKFKAGEKKDDKGTIELLQTSRRGIGKKTVEFTVGPIDYRLSGSSGGNGFSATKCEGLAGAWTINVGIPGGGGTTTFTLLEDPATRVPAHSAWGFSVGDATSSIDLNGTASATVDAEGKATLHLALGSGTLKIRSPGGSSTVPYTVPGTDSFPLEQGSFCGAPA